jgi:hypothetical protein
MTGHGSMQRSRASGVRSNASEPGETGEFPSCRPLLGQGAHGIDWMTLSLVLAAAVTIQATIPTARLGTTYRALEFGISPP